MMLCFKNQRAAMFRSAPLNDSRGSRVTLYPPQAIKFSDFLPIDHRRVVCGTRPKLVSESPVACVAVRSGIDNVCTARAAEREGKGVVIPMQPDFPHIGDDMEACIP